ncbi:MAG: DUF1036 domain-containing protein [Maritimibacter sp.]
MLARLLVPVTISLLSYVAPTAALAGFEVCNETPHRATVAIGYKDDGTWTSEGWWGVDPGKCRTVVSADLNRKFMYWRATSSEMSWSHDTYMFCTDSSAFTIAGDNDCDSRGYKRVGFNEIDLGTASHYTLTLTGGTKSDPEENIEYPEDEYDEPAAGDPGFGPEPGTYGEPYSILGVLSHCEYYDAGIGCTFVADGWSYVASTYEDTPEDVLVRLDELGLNVPISVSGDMKSYEGSEAIVTVREFSLQPADSYQIWRDSMQGFWTSDDDQNFQILVHGSTYEEYYQGAPNDLSMMHFTESCADSPGEPPAFNLVNRDGTSDVCMYISHIGNGNMELFPSGSMRPLYFTFGN